MFAETPLHTRFQPKLGCPGRETQGLAAAGVIHSDFEKKAIGAETIAYDDF
jgi:hypothetical protein